MSNIYKKCFNKKCENEGTDAHYSLLYGLIWLCHEHHIEEHRKENVLKELKEVKG